MSDALIGHTGFVGSNLFRQHPFGDCFNSANIESIAGRRFDTVVCSGVRAEKWIANGDPAADRARIDRLLVPLSEVKATRMVLISTVDVFPVPRDVDEDTPVDSSMAQPYGVNRRFLEEALAERFDTLVVRLPGLYARGLKKNVIYDLVHDHELHKVDSRGEFQYYGVDRLWADIEIALAATLRVVHLVTEPVDVETVATQAFGQTFVNHLDRPPVRYDVHTRHAERFGGRGHYVESRDQVLAGLRRFVADERAITTGERGAA
jgi:nucleoside-diphosphate-sugar epimerase